VTESAAVDSAVVIEVAGNRGTGREQVRVLSPLDQALSGDLAGVVDGGCVR